MGGRNFRQYIEITYGEAGHRPVMIHVIGCYGYLRVEVDYLSTKVSVSQHTREKWSVNRVGTNGI